MRIIKPLEEPNLDSFEFFSLNLYNKENNPKNDKRTDHNNIAFLQVEKNIPELTK